MTDSELENAVSKHYKAILKVAMSFTQNMSDSEDIAEEAFIKLYFRYKSLPDDKQTRAWLIRVTANLCKNHLRSLRLNRRAELSDNLIDNNVGFSDEDRHGLQTALESLKPNYRAVIHLYYYEGLSAEEIGKVLGISKTAVTSRLQRGREKLRKFLSD